MKLKEKAAVFIGTILLRIMLKIIKLGGWMAASSLLINHVEELEKRYF